jgi:hypothetical protein
MEPFQREGVGTCLSRCLDSVVNLELLQDLDDQRQAQRRHHGIVFHKSLCPPFGFVVAIATDYRTRGTT